MDGSSNVRAMGWTRRSAAVSVLLVMEEHRKQAGLRLAQLREARGWTQRELSDQSGVSEKTISRFENGRYEGRRGTVRSLATALGVDPDDITGPPPAPLGLNGQPSQLDRIEELLVSLHAKLDRLLPDHVGEGLGAAELAALALPAPDPAPKRSPRAKRQPRSHRQA